MCDNEYDDIPVIAYEKKRDFLYFYCVILLCDVIITIKVQTNMYIHMCVYG